MSVPFGPNEVAIDGTFFDAKGFVESIPNNVYPGKTVIGDTTKDSQVDRSNIAWTDLRGGMLQYRVDGQGDVNRSWYSTAQAGEGHLVLPALVTTTADVGGAGDDTARVLIEFGGGIYADASGAIYTYDDQADSWGSALHTLPEPASKAVVWRAPSGTVYLIFATRKGYTYYDGTTWTDGTEDMIYIAVWNDQLWGIDIAGQLRRSSTIGTWTNDAVLPAEDGVVTALFVSGDASNTPILYVASTRGLFAHDNDNTRFQETELPFQHPDLGVGSRKWLGNQYLPAGLTVYEYIADATPAQVNLVGLDRDDGLPSDRRGKIVQLEGSPFRLFALVENTTPTSFGTTTGSITSLDVFASAGNRGRGTVRPRELGISIIFAWDRIGWQVVWESADSTEGITTAVVAGAYGKHRLWFAQNQRIFYMDLPRDIVNPTQVSDYEYASAYTHLTPWFTAGQTEVSKLALLLRAETINPTTSETLTIGYRLNYSTGAFTTWTAISVTGETALPFPVTGDAVGVEFRAIQFQIVAAQGSSNKNTPDLVSLTLEWRKKLPLKWTNTVELVIADKPDRKTTAKAQRAAIRTALGAGTLVKLETGPDSDQTYLGDLKLAPGVRLSGTDKRGSIKITHVEQ
jgi:hypothetical protein